MDTTVLEREKSLSRGITVADLGKARLVQVISVLIAASLGFIYWRTMQWWWLVWWAEESYYSHGVLIPIISAFIVYFNHRRIAKASVEPSAWGLPMLLLAVLIHFVAHRGGVLSVSGLTLPVALLGMSLLIFGIKTTVKEFAFPILFLFFMCVPPTMILAKLNFKIQMLSTVFATIGLKLIGIDAVQSGARITLPNIEVLVGAPCSGFRMLIALLAFTTIFAYMKAGPRWGRLSLVALVVPISLIANSIRVLMIALVGNIWGETAMKSFHDYSGYIVLVIAFVVLAQIAKVVKCREFKSMPA